MILFFPWSYFAVVNKVIGMGVCAQDEECLFTWKQGERASYSWNIKTRPNCNIVRNPPIFIYMSPLLYASILYLVFLLLYGKLEKMTGTSHQNTEIESSTFVQEQKLLFVALRFLNIRSQNSNGKISVMMKNVFYLQDSPPSHSIKLVD